MARRQRQTENNIPENEPTSAAEIKSPVTLWFRPVKDTETDATEFIDVHLMLEDAELGVMPPNMYFFAAENSKRAEELNFIAIDSIAYALDTAKTEWNAEPTFSLMVTTRFLESDETFNAFLAKLESMEIARKRIILTFSALTVLHLGRRVNTYLRLLREEGYTVALTDYAVDTAHFSLLFDYTFDILRIDADYLADSYMYSRKKSAVEVLVAFAAKENIKLIANGVGDMKMKSVMSELGLTVMCGRAVARGTDKLERALGIETKEEPEEKGEEEGEEHPFETVEAEAPAARASASKKIKNKTAVLEEEVEALENAPEPTDIEEETTTASETSNFTASESEAEEAISPSQSDDFTASDDEAAEAMPEAEEPVEEEAAEVEEPIEEVEEQPEVEEPTEVEEPAEVEVEEQIEVVEETTAEEPTDIEEISETATEGSNDTADEVRNEETTTASETSNFTATEGGNFTASDGEAEEAMPASEASDENAALAEFLLSAGIDFLTEEDMAKVLYGGLDALDEEKRNKVIEALENLG